MDKTHAIGKNVAKFGCSFFCGMAKLDVQMQSLFNEMWPTIVQKEANRLIDNLRKASNKAQSEIDDEIKTIKDIVPLLSKVYRLTLPEEVDTETVNNNKRLDLQPGDSINDLRSINSDLLEKNAKQIAHLDGTDYRILEQSDNDNTNARWTYKVNSRSEMRTLFTDGFIDSLEPSRTNKKNKGPYKDIYNYRIYIRKKMRIFSDEETSTEAFIDYIDYMCRPDGLLVVSLKTDNCGMTLDNIADLQFRIKMINWYTEDGPFGHSSIPYLFLFYPLIYAKFNGKQMTWEANVKSAFHQMFIGNKFYVYSVQQLNNELGVDEKTHIPHFDYALYALGKLVDTDTMLNPNAFDYPSSKYYQGIMDKNTLSLYDNWKALALNETFTILCQPSLNPGTMGEMVTSRYKLFLAVVYQKSFIFYMNMKYQHEEITQDMADKILEFDRYFNIALPSYNEVPIMFYNKMRESMGVEEVYEVLSRKITTSAQKHAERRDRSFNTAIGYLAVLAIFSAIIDYISVLKFFNANGVGDHCEDAKIILNNWLPLFIIICIVVVFGLQIFSRYRVFKGSWNYICNVISSIINAKHKA
jgi:hypothetical protein